MLTSIWPASEQQEIHGRNLTNNISFQKSNRTWTTVLNVRSQRERRGELRVGDAVAHEDGLTQWRREDERAVDGPLVELRHLVKHAVVQHGTAVV